MNSNLLGFGMRHGARPVASLRRAGGLGDKQGGTEFEGGVVGEVLGIRGGVVSEVLGIRGGGSQRGFMNSTGG